VDAIMQSINATYLSGLDQALEGIRRMVQELVQSFRQSLPATWRGLDSDQLQRAIDLATESGLVLVWAPRETIVFTLVATADEDECRDALVARETAVLEDVADALGTASYFVAAAHEEARDMGSKAVAAARCGHREAAQALAAAALSLLLHEVLDYNQLGAAYKEFSTRDVDDVVLSLLRITTIELATARAPTTTADHEIGFNRHGTLHGKPAYFSTSDCLAALLLLSAWICELSSWQEHHPDAITRA
jgi:hypothetical protein